MFTGGEMENKGGFSLLEVMVTSAVAMVTAFAVLSLSTFIGRSNQATQQSTDMLNYQNLLVTSLYDPNTCKGALQNANGGPVDFSAVTLANPNFPAAGISVGQIALGGAVFMKTGQKSSSFTTNSITLTQIRAGRPDGTLPYSVWLTIVGDKGTGAVGGNLHSINVGLSLLLAPGLPGQLTIQSCSSTLPAMPSPTWSVPPASVFQKKLYSYGWNVNSKDSTGTATNELKSNSPFGWPTAWPSPTPTPVGKYTDVERVEPGTYSVTIVAAAYPCRANWGCDSNPNGWPALVATVNGSAQTRYYYTDDEYVVSSPKAVNFAWSSVAVVADGNPDGLGPLTIVLDNPTGGQMAVEEPILTATKIGP